MKGDGKRKTAERLDGLDPDEQVEIVEELGRSGDREAVTLLIDVLDRSVGDFDKRFLVHAIIRALGRMKAKKALPVLLKALESSVHYIKGTAARAIGEVEPDAGAVGKLEEVLVGDTPNEVKKDVIAGLGKTKNRKAVEPLAEVVRNEPDPEVKRAAIHAMGETERAEAVKPLTDFFRKEADEQLKTEVINALAEIASDGSVEFLKHALEDGNPEIRICAAEALGEAGNTTAEAHLKELLRDPDERVRKAAARALGVLLFGPT